MKIITKNEVKQTTPNDRPKLEDLFFPQIYVSCWINHGCFFGAAYNCTTLSMAIHFAKMEVCIEMGEKFFSHPLQGEGMQPYFYAGAQEKWVWMNRVSNNEPIPFIHRTIGVTRRVDVEGVKVYWREPKNP